jgi:hypothetical protein
LALVTIQDRCLAGEVSISIIVHDIVIGGPGPWAENLDTLINAFIGAYKDNLTLWNVKVHGQVFNPFDEEIPDTELLLCCYFNIGIDAEVGASFERKRTKSRLCNYLLYCLYACRKLSSPN